MRKFLSNKSIALLLIGILFFIPVSLAFAQESNFTTGAAGVVGKMVLGTFDFVSVILSPLVNSLVMVVSWVTMLSGVILNASIYYTVIAMSENIGSLPAIDVTWTVIRDVANIGFIFMLLYSSILKIVGREKDTNGLIVKMVVAAVLVNFSLFFTKVFIDVTNLIALTFYKAIAPTALLGPSNFLNAGLSNSIIDALGTQKLWQMIGDVNGSVILTSSVMTIIVLIVTTFIFSAMAVMFIVRYVALIFVLVLSPIMFLSMVFPGLGGYASKWKSTLIGQSVFAPVFMLMTWVTVILIRGISDTVFIGMEPLGNALTSTSFTVGAVPTLVNYVVIIIFLIASFTISKGFADQADGSIKKLGSWALGFAGGAASGAGGFAGRKIIGRFGNSQANNNDLIVRANQTEFNGIRDRMSGAGARLGLYAAKKMASGSYDVRNASIPTAAVGDLVRGTIGRTTLGKYIGANDLRTSSIEVGKPFAKLTSLPSADEKGYKELEDEKKKRLEGEEKTQKEELKKAETKLKNQTGIDAAKAKAAGQPFNQADINSLLDAMRKMSDKEIESQKAEVLALKDVAENLNPKQLEFIQTKSDKFTDEEKKKIFDSHFADLENIDASVAAVDAGTATPDQKRAVQKLKNLSDKELELLPEEIFNASNISTRERAVLKTLSQSQVDAISKNKNVTDKQAIKDERGRPINEAFSTSNWSDAKSMMEGMKIPDLVKLDVAKLSNSNILNIYDPSLLTKMVSQPDLTTAKTKAIRDAIINEATRPGGSPAPEIVVAANWLTGPGQTIF